MMDVPEDDSDLLKDIAEEIDMRASTAGGEVIDMTIMMFWKWILMPNHLPLNERYVVYFDTVAFNDFPCACKILTTIFHHFPNTHA